MYSNEKNKLLYIQSIICSIKNHQHLRIYRYAREVQYQCIQKGPNCNLAKSEILHLYKLILIWSEWLLAFILVLLQIHVTSVKVLNYQSNSKANLAISNLKIKNALCRCIIERMNNILRTVTIYSYPVTLNSTPPPSTRNNSSSTN